MHRRPHRLALAIVLVAVSLAPLAPPALAAPFRSPAEPVPSFDPRAQDIAIAFWDRLLSFCVPFRVTRSAWTKEGITVDPNGAPRPTSEPAQPTVDEGGMIDPNGRQ
jgi:hypothetical protein